MTVLGQDNHFQFAEFDPNQSAQPTPSLTQNIGLLRQLLILRCRASITDLPAIQFLTC